METKETVLAHFIKIIVYIYNNCKSLVAKKEQILKSVFI